MKVREVLKLLDDRRRSVYRWRRKVRDFSLRNRGQHLGERVEEPSGQGTLLAPCCDLCRSGRTEPRPCVRLRSCPTAECAAAPTAIDLIGSGGGRAIGAPPDGV
jgi:hypothetical protein